MLKKILIFLLLFIILICTFTPLKIKECFYNTLYNMKQEINYDLLKMYLSLEVIEKENSIDKVEVNNMNRLFV